MNQLRNDKQTKHSMSENKMHLERKFGVKKYVILLSLVLGNLVEQPTPEVTIEQGKLRGRISVDGLAYEYLGIPYATSNETNRFQAPYPAPHWSGVLNAVDEHYVCLQIFGDFIALGQEDCLKINVYAPVDAINLPVMVYIHGGGFFEGSGNPFLYGTGNFIEKGVIVVTFNYRLAALGFLCLGLPEAPGNAGLKDQLAALRWVNRNIAAFGGDPDNVTVFGESAGGGSIAHLKINSISDGLFKRAIMQSGSLLPTWAISADPINTAALIAEQFGYFTNDPEELLKIYKNISLSTLMRSKRPVKKGTIGVNRVCFMPCIEREFASTESIITESPFGKLRSGNYRHIPILSGFNNKEGYAMVGKENKKLLQEKEEVFTESLPTDLEFVSDTDKENLSKTFRNMYFGEKPISMETILNLSEFYGDYFFSMFVQMEADIVSKISKEPMYNYVFKYSGSRNIVKAISGFRHETGAAHADDLFYLFKTSLIPQLLLTKDDKVMIDRLTTMWTNFAKYGDPTPFTSDLLPVKWIPSDSHELRFLYIDQQMKMGGILHPERYRLWNETYTKFRRKYYRVGENTPKELLWI